MTTKAQLPKFVPKKRFTPTVEHTLMSIGVLLLLFVAFKFFTKPKEQDRHIGLASVMITDKKSQRGGTGIILSSNRKESRILTNRHVCGVLERGGGLVHSFLGISQVVTYIKSDRSDLCLLTVSDNLLTNTKVSEQTLHMYDKVSVSGHPSLLPNVITRGHASAHQIIQVMVGFKPCTEEDVQNVDKFAYCLFMGGLPIIESFEAQLVTATIMPGSSGSGVYNSNNELVGVVFAGQGELAYGWIVPYEQVLAFLHTSHELNEVVVDQKVDMFQQQQQHKTVDKIKLKQQCEISTDKNFKMVCDLLNNDMIWEKK